MKRSYFNPVIFKNDRLLITLLEIHVLPCVTNEETELCIILNRAYSEARYNEKYSVSEGTVRILIERVAKFIGHCPKALQGKVT
ncbi:hypothetical protein BW716_17235 [[Flexibacter] sp. ATCC 35208]|nr:hypothetical protein BW716_17235 [[Flexibacter] sp. ATCC 35208]